MIVKVPAWAARNGNWTVAAPVMLDFWSVKYGRLCFEGHSAEFGG